METSFVSHFCLVFLALNFVETSIVTEELVNGRTIDDNKYVFCQHPREPRDCAEVHDQCGGTINNGVYTIRPDGFDTPFDVYCDQDDGGVWTVIQRRSIGEVDFNRSKSEYREGFGFLNGEFRIGNEKLAYMTNQRNYVLRIDMTTSNGSSFSVTYDMFRIGDEWSGYRLLNVSRYDGTADIQWCPTNMVVSDCSCITSCDHPYVQCERKCTDTDTCVCPEGFLMNGDDCVSSEDCGCFEPGIGVIPEATSTLNDDCSKRCTCERGQLACTGGHQCDENALCEDRNTTRGCYCRDGYRGDGTTCTDVHWDCYDVYTSGSVDDGVYTVHPTGWSGPGFRVYCNMSDGGGWTVFQRRQDGSVDFYQDWANYRDGFGTLTTEFWLGNEKLHHLIGQQNYGMRIEIVNSDGVRYSLNYDSIEIGDGADNYRLTLGNFTGNTDYDYMSDHRGMAFTTRDNGNDNRGGGCATSFHGGWWYKDCYTANLNGDYDTEGQSSVALYDRGASDTEQNNLQYTEMKIRPA